LQRQTDLARLHIDGLSRLLNELNGTGIQLVEHHFHGSGVPRFTLTFDRAIYRVRFSWNAESEYLEVKFSKAPAIPLDRDAYISLPNGKGLYEEMASELEQLLAT
jgi:hypothetical protein